MAADDGYVKLFVDETSLYNRIVLGSLLPGSAWEPLPHWLQTLLRNYIGGILIYFISGFLWCFYIYYLKLNVYVPKAILYSPENAAMGDGYAKLFMDETSFYNRIVLGSLLPASVWEPLPHSLQTWLRNYIGGILIYFISTFLWCFYIYYLKRNVYAPKDEIPTKKAMFLQIYISMKAMPWYCTLPTLSEYMVEYGWTRCFPRISDVGWIAYLVYILMYFVLVEFGIYWVHRELHDIKPIYKYLHACHHSYNKKNTLSPFAGMAFNPLDGLLQGMPHAIAPLLVPTHFTTHIALIFLEAIWTANIHDCIHAKIWPVMGAGYHTIHHTTYRHNYGHYTIWMDWMFGTLRDPVLEDDGSQKDT